MRTRSLQGEFTIRQSLFGVLLLLVLLLTSMFLSLTGFVLRGEINRTALMEMARARDSYRAMERQRQQALLRQTSLLSELPSLKALMTTRDKPTIQDAGAAFWRTVGSDIFALMSPEGKLMAMYAADGVAPEELASPLRDSREHGLSSTIRSPRGRVFQVATIPIFFSGGDHPVLLGYVTTGDELNDALARSVVRPEGSQVLFASGGGFVASTLPAREGRSLLPSVATMMEKDGTIQRVQANGGTYLATSILLEPAGEGSPALWMVVLRSYEETTAVLRQLNAGIVLLSVAALLLGSIVVFFFARRVTEPLESLLQSTRRFSQGEEPALLAPRGPSELRELLRAFERMRSELLESHAKLLDAERQAMIGRMASSMSHDLRHYLSPIYANAEFLASRRFSEQEETDLLQEITEAARGMDEMLNAILAFSRTGTTVRCQPCSITEAVQRAFLFIQSHPEARKVSFSADLLEGVSGEVDAGELQRAVSNLLLNACQAANQTASAAVVRLAMEVDHTGDKPMACIRVLDNGDGVAAEILPRLFEPFVSLGKERGVGLGLAQARRFAAAYGGTIDVHRVKVASADAPELTMTEFHLRIPVLETMPPGSANARREEVAL